MAVDSVPARTYGRRPMRVRTGIIRAGAAAVMVASVIAVRTPATDADTVRDADAITDLGIDDSARWSWTTPGIS
jgi:hypothetical protein